LAKNWYFKHNHREAKQTKKEKTAQFINRTKKLTYIVITPAAIHEADILSAPKTPQIIATERKQKKQLKISFKENYECR